MDRAYKVYCLTLKEDGRKYFGVTCQNLHMRWKQGQGYKGSTRIYDAIQKYGWESFYHHVVKEFHSKKQAYDYEELMINTYRTTEEKYGFNLQSGGEHPKQNDVSIELTASKIRGVKITGERLDKIRERAKIRDNTVFAHPMSEETKLKISKSRLGIKCSDTAKMRSKEEFSIPVVCVELNRIFSSMTEAAIFAGTSKTAIWSAVRGRTKTSMGYHWKQY